MDYYIHDRATVIGNVTVGTGSSFWPGSVARGDTSTITVAGYSSIQDNAVIHCDSRFPVSIGSFVTIGHGAVVHGAVIEDFCLVGMNSVILNGAKLGRGTVIAAGTVVSGSSNIPPCSLVVGNPVEVKENRYRDLKMQIRSAVIYSLLTREYMVHGGVTTDMSKEIDRISTTEADRLWDLMDHGNELWIQNWDPPVLG